MMVSRVKFSLVFVVLLLMVFTVSCQDRYDSPQDVEWNDPPIASGYTILATEVSVLPLGADKTIEGNYVLIGQATLNEIMINLEEAGVQGDYVVAIRYLMQWNTETYYDEYAYSDLVEDTDPNGPFVIRLRVGHRPMLIHIKGS